MWWPAWKSLSRHGLFSRESEGDNVVYSFGPDEKTAALVERVIASYRLTREAVYSEVLALQQKQDELRREYQRILFTERGRTETILNSLEESVLVLNRAETVLLANGQFYERFAPAGIAEREGQGLEELAASGEIAGAVRSSIAMMGEKSREEMESATGSASTAFRARRSLGRTARSSRARRAARPPRSRYSGISRRTGKSSACARTSSPC